MPAILPQKIDRLRSLISEMGAVAVAVSGGVDSVTLSLLSSQASPAKAHMYHAVSPAVPSEATARLYRLAQHYGWQLTVFNAGEFEREGYLKNPVNRCFYCKSSLYEAIARQTDAPIVSGTNVDDLHDFRPGLQAARNASVRHPFVEADVDKREVREIARALGLGEIAELPASPCLSSRVETGIPIQASMLKLIHSAERWILEQVHSESVRCRVRAAGVVIEMDCATLESLTDEDGARLKAGVATIFSSSNQRVPISLAPYRKGSAFLVPLDEPPRH